MASASRGKQFSELYRVLKKHYKPVRPDFQRPVLEHLLFACCLEDAHYEPAEETFAALVHTFFDWNEIRVTSLRELAEVAGSLPDPRAVANRLKRVLQSVFEETYSFDLESLRKKNLGPTVKWLSKLDGTTGFTVAYVVQSALGGHAIPVDSGTLRALRLAELISAEDVESGVVPGVERAIPKAKGVEFGSLLHQFGADFTANPYSPLVREILLEVNPNVADRLPKRRVLKPPRKPVPAEPSGPADAQASSTTPEQQPPEEVQPPAGEQGASDTPQPPPPEAKKKPAATRKKTPSAPSTPEQTSAAKTPPDPVAKGKRSASEPLSKRKPR